MLLFCVVAACSTIPEGQRSTREASGPPEVQLATVESHARQFDEEEPERPAGSQEELAASAYLVAHLTEAGYVSRLDAVPVRDLVRSTNVVALPPDGGDPAAVVVVAYDTAPGETPGGTSIGLWLEVARALRVLEPGHSIEFVALGAENTSVGGGRLGSRRLVSQLREEAESPQVFVIEGAGSAAGAGGDADEDTSGVFEAAGFETTVVGGPAREAGATLLDLLGTL